MRVAFFLAALLLAALSLHFAYPAAAAAGCPTCYGFSEVSDQLFIERTTSSEQRRAGEAVIKGAWERLSAYYGPLAGRPRILLCASEACYERFGGRSRGIALLDYALFLSPRGVDIVIATHELAHIELHSRIGLMKTIRRAVPQWFDEGLAVVISDDPRYLTANRTGDRCRVEPDGEMPASQAAWIERAQSADLYSKAACRVSRWLSAHGGASAVPQFADAIAEGTSFARATE